MKRIFIASAMMCLTVSQVWAQLPKTKADEKKEAFSYFKISKDQLGFKDCPEATGVTNGGIFSNAHLAIEFLAGKGLQSATNRVVLPEKGYLPIIGYTLVRDGIEYKMEAFSVPKDFKPQNNLISYISWRVTNRTKKAAKASLGFKLTSFFPNDTKNPLRDNLYSTEWYTKQFMNEDAYLKNVSQIKTVNHNLYIGNHLVLNLPQNVELKNSGSDKKQWSGTVDLAAGESKVISYKMPFIPIESSNAAIQDVEQKVDLASLKQKLTTFWDNELNQVNKFVVPEEKVMNMYRGSYVNMLNARDIMEDGVGIIQRCNEYQYDYFYVRDNAYFTRVYDMLGRFEEAGKIIQPYFIKDIEGNDLQFQQRTGIYKKLCFDYWGQVLWAFGSHIKQTGDTALLKRVYKLLPNHIQDYESMVELDSRGLWPKTWPYDNEHITGHYTGHNFWVILGLRNAIYMANLMGNKKDVKEWTEMYDKFSANFKKELDQITSKTGGYIPPGMDNPVDGFDWDNASAGLYPFEVIDKKDPSVRTTLEMVRNYNFQEGISTYEGCNALVAKQKVLNNEPMPWRGLHHYETFYVSNGNLILDEQQKCIEDLYSILVHTSSTNGGFEWRPTPWGNRDFEHNKTPHGWLAARYIEYLRNMLVREEGNDVHLLSAISPEWAKRNDEIRVNEAPTYYGNVSYTVQFSKNTLVMKMANKLSMNGGKVFVHIPWFIRANDIKVDGKTVQALDNTLEIAPDTKEIVITWNDATRPEHLNFATALNYYLDKFYDKSATANYTSLFPKLAAPGYIKGKNPKEVTLFSPDNYAPIYYTTDGSEPSKSSKVYQKPVILSGNMVLKAVCIDKDGRVSDSRTISLNN
ncbi:chitobiase/beta-hexosaminidase C-terminal domain-containing protein [Pedobacter sp. MW01-1-1]|uniref:chitobiase/beta-hexosaminidase C-terminal domain-containing protein n=1 Tax=Pedobacter sp. MW01-1-1 TaxID=3383027 RepID=UPI003FEE5458